MKITEELEKWLREFYDIASYHSGDYKEGMYRVLDGLNSQIDYFKRLELENISASVPAR